MTGHRSLKGRAGHTATLVGKKIFVIGGRNANVFYNDVWVFDTEKEQWQQVQAHASLSARAYHTTTLVRDSELWVIGGSDKDVMYGDVHMFNTDTLEVIISLGFGISKRASDGCFFLSASTSRRI